MSKEFHIVVVGGGHAGCEAALAAARRGCQVLLLTIDPQKIAQMPCNPAVGGIGKGHLVKELDALGGEMGVNTDKAGIQFRILNTRKGPAVRATRVQCDKDLYATKMQETLSKQENLTILPGTVDRILTQNGSVTGVRTSSGDTLATRAVALSSGTFLKGLMHIGLTHLPGGRAGEPSAEHLSDCMLDFGFEVGRLIFFNCLHAATAAVFRIKAAAVVRLNCVRLFRRYIQYRLLSDRRWSCPTEPGDRMTVVTKQCLWETNYETANG